MKRFALLVVLLVLPAIVFARISNNTQLFKLPFSTSKDNFAALALNWDCYPGKFENGSGRISPDSDIATWSAYEDVVTYYNPDLKIVRQPGTLGDIFVAEKGKPYSVHSNPQGKYRWGKYVRITDGFQFRWVNIEDGIWCNLKK